MLTHVEKCAAPDHFYGLRSCDVSDLVPLTLQVDALLVCLHLRLLHFALQLAVRLLQVVVVSEGKSTERSHRCCSFL